VRRPTLIWAGYAIVAAALALLGVGHWLWAVTLRGPVMYGEGAVAHAAILARDHLEYTIGAHYGDVPTIFQAANYPIFTAANYPPLYFHLAGIGDDPFVTGRVLSIAATLFVAGAIAWRARPAGRLTAGAIALAWLGSVPVLEWGAAVKPDLVALALTVAAVLALDRAQPRHALAGALLGLAAMAKPTALLPALAILVFEGRRDRAAALRGLASGLVVATVVTFLTRQPDKLVKVHILDWNALPWRPELAASLVLFGLMLLAVPLVTIAVTHPSRTVVTAYAVGAVGILLLGGREGATINYLLDLSAAIALALAGRAPHLRTTTWYPVAAVAQAAVAVALLNPFGVIPGRAVTPGAWGDPSRIGAVGTIAGWVLVEDSGLLVANGREPIVDDVFLWSRVYAHASETGQQFGEGSVLLDAVRAGRFDAIVAEVDLGELDALGGSERQRWHPDLVAAVLERYALRPASGLVDRPLFVYTRR
jgi:hypothetical protein